MIMMATKTKQVCFYCNIIFLPFASNLHKSCNSWQEGVSITGYMKVVSLYDGDHAQIQSIIDSINKYATYHIDTLKQNDTCIGTNQVDDLCRFFP